MGTWSASITGNDTAMDLRSEYTCAFYYYGIDEAVNKIDEYVRNQVCDESDPEEWCNYVYSLADFMWKKGILTDEIKNRALNMIDNEFGLEIWAESGEKIVRQRKRVLEKFREQLTSPLPKQKKIKPSVNMKQIFEDGDIIAIQLITKDKPFASWAALVSDLCYEDFQSKDGKYILIQKVCSTASWQSAIVPEIKDYWAVFRLFDGVYDEVPKNVNVDTLKESRIISRNKIYSAFLCESSMFYFKRRKYQVIGHQEVDDKAYGGADYADIFLGVSNNCWDPDAQFLASMGRTVNIQKYNGSLERLFEIAYQAKQYGSYNYGLSKEENNGRRAKEKKRIRDNIEQAFSKNADFYTISFGKECGFASVLDGRIENVFIHGHFQKLGLGTELIRYVSKETGGQAYMNIPEGKNANVLIHICEKTGIKFFCI